MDTEQQGHERNVRRISDHFNKLSPLTELLAFLFCGLPWPTV